MEVSELWVHREESNAASISALDRCLLGVENTSKDDRCAPSPNNPSEQQADHESTSLSEEKECYWLGHLDLTCLTVLENMIRDGEVDEMENGETSMPDLVLNPDPSIGIHGGYIALHRPNESHETSLQEIGQSTISEQPAVKTSVQKSLKNLLNISKGDILRKLQKRLYMRRKRAEQTGRTIISGSSRLRPGRRKKTRNPPKPRPKTYNTHRKIRLGERCASPLKDHLVNHGELSEAVEGEGLPYESRSQGGTTKPYRVRKFLQDHDIDVEALANINLTLFHLSTLARLMRLYYSVHESNADADDASISADTISFLVTIITEFVSEAIRRVIITKEQEIRLKRELKVWKYDRDEITADNILESLSSMGLGHLKKENYFERMLQEANYGTPPERTAVVLSGENAAASRANLTERLDMKGLLHTRHVTFPQSLLCNQMGDYRHLSGSSLLANDAYEEEVQRQLKEEEELNMEDERSSKDFEKHLWDLNT
ncbi:hypothetical protein CPB84DRAFT_395944 [Gymnopilus junonius]|uniref:Uncharacterized protein n=1 Tax=Gymnopilus junonius TaxID=109634 RepID=A0A9P5NVA1_GYMJU|nr:hypothetical protein CPB84DRAFT_395944 [Gymnopilus junonius]